MPTEAFDFRGAEDQALSGRFEAPSGTPRGFALFVHCFTCGKSSIAATRIARGLARRGVGVLRFDLTGVGDSEGDFSRTTFAGRTDDVTAAAAAMASAGRAPRLLIGHSLGGAAALAAACRLPEVAAVCTIGAPFDVRHVRGVLGEAADTIDQEGEAEVTIGGRIVRLRRAFLEDLGKHDQETRIRSLARPLLILHSPLDEVVGIDNAAEIFQVARHPKSFVCLDGADHLLTRAQDAEFASALIAAWSRRYLEG